MLQVLCFAFLYLIFTKVQEIDPVSLLPKSLFHLESLNDMFKGQTSCPRPQVQQIEFHFRAVTNTKWLQYDPKTKEWFNFVMDFGYRTTDYNIYVIEKNDKREPLGKLLARINAPPSIVHSLAITDNYVILVNITELHSWCRYLTYIL
jgi:hypothetical protein